jgi:hypothetical protein
MLQSAKHQQAWRMAQPDQPSSWPLGQGRLPHHPPHRHCHLHPHPGWLRLPGTQLYQQPAAPAGAVTAFPAITFHKARVTVGRSIAICPKPSLVVSQACCPGCVGLAASLVPAVFLFGMMRVHMTFVTTVGLPLDNVTPPESESSHHHHQQPQ